MIFNEGAEAVEQWHGYVALNFKIIPCIKLSRSCFNLNRLVGHHLCQQHAGESNPCDERYDSVRGNTTLFAKIKHTRDADTTAQWNSENATNCSTTKACQ